MSGNCGKKGAAWDEGEPSLASWIVGRAERISRHFAECLEGAEECLAAAPTFRGMSAGSGLFCHWVSDTRCQFGGDDLGVAVEGQNGQRLGDAPDGTSRTSGTGKTGGATAARRAHRGMRVNGVWRAGLQGGRVSRNFANCLEGREECSAAVDDIPRNVGGRGLVVLARGVGHLAPVRRG